MDKLEYGYGFVDLFMDKFEKEFVFQKSSSFVYICFRLFIYTIDNTHLIICITRRRIKCVLANWYFPRHITVKLNLRVCIKGESKASIP